MVINEHDVRLKFAEGEQALFHAAGGHHIPFLQAEQSLQRKTNLLFIVDAQNGRVILHDFSPPPE